jgi:hypothetical protein
MVTGEDGKPKVKHTGKRAVVEVGFHSLRHTFVSLCRESGAPLAVVEAIVGHASPAMTRHYTHIGEAAARASVAALPSVLGDATAPAALPAPAGETAATGTGTGAAGVRKTVPEWLRAALSGILASLDAGQTDAARRELAALTT